MICYEKHPSYSLSQGRQSKPQPVADLDTSVCLRTTEFSAFTQLSRSLAPTPVLLSLGFHLPVPSREITANPGRLGRKLCHFVLCSCSQLPVLGIIGQGPLAPPSICLHVLPDLQGLSLLLGSFLQPGSSPSFQAHFFFETTSFWEHNLNSLCAEA